MSGKSANNQPATYQAQAGGCVNISRPDKCYKSQRTCGIHIAVNVLSSRPSARIALLELKHAEERALQQRKFEAERRALEQEKKLIQKKYNLLEQQSSVRRSTKRSLRAVHIADEVKQNAQHSVSDGNETLFDEQQSNHNIQPPILLDQLPKQTQLCEIQHRNTDSLPKTIPNGQETSDDSGLLTKGNITTCLSSEVPSSESGNEINRDVLVESISGSPCSECSSLDFENNLTTLRFMSSTVCFSSIVKKGEIYLDQNASGTLYKLQVQLYVPPRLVSPAVPNPAPPPSDQEVRRTETFRVDPAAIIISVFESLIRCSSISSNMFSEASSEMFSTERNAFCYRFSKQPFKELKNQISEYVDLSRLMLRVKRCSSAHCDGIIDRRSIRLLWDTVNSSLESNRAQIHLITKQFSSVSTISVQKSASRFHNLPQHDCSDQHVSLTTITEKKSHDRGCCRPAQTLSCCREPDVSRCRESFNKRNEVRQSMGKRPYSLTNFESPVDMLQDRRSVIWTHKLAIPFKETNSLSILQSISSSLCAISNVSRGYKSSNRVHRVPRSRPTSLRTASIVRMRPQSKSLYGLVLVPPIHQGVKDDFHNQRNGRHSYVIFHNETETVTLWMNETGAVMVTEMMNRRTSNARC